MSIKYHIQELPRMRQGEQALYPVPEVYTQFDNHMMVERIALESGVRSGSILGTLDALPKSLKTFLLEGHSCRIDGLGTFSLSLGIDNNGRVFPKRLNLKIDPAFMKELREEAVFELSRPDVVRAAGSKGHRDEHFALLVGWLKNHDRITLQKYADLVHVSVATASRELNYFASSPDYCIKTVGSGNRKFWTR